MMRPGYVLALPAFVRHTDALPAEQSAAVVQALINLLTPEEIRSETEALNRLPPRRAHHVEAAS